MPVIGNSKLHGFAHHLGFQFNPLLGDPVARLVRAYRLYLLGKSTLLDLNAAIEKKC